VAWTLDALDRSDATYAKDFAAGGGVLIGITAALEA
jgi:hypothetical protein